MAGDFWASGVVQRLPEEMAKGKLGTIVSTSG